MAEKGFGSMEPQKPKVETQPEKEENKVEELQSKLKNPNLGEDTQTNLSLEGVDNYIEGIPEEWKSILDNNKKEYVKNIGEEERYYKTLTDDDSRGETNYEIHRLKQGLLGIDLMEQDQKNIFENIKESKEFIISEIERYIEDDDLGDFFYPEQKIKLDGVRSDKEVYGEMTIQYRYDEFENSVKTFTMWFGEFTDGFNNDFNVEVLKLEEIPIELRKPFLERLKIAMEENMERHGDQNNYSSSRIKALEKTLELL